MFNLVVAEMLQIHCVIADELANIWLLDEPGANLDAEGRAMVRREIKKAAAAGRLVLLATNDAEEEAQADACIALSGN